MFSKLEAENLQQRVIANVQFVSIKVNSIMKEKFKGFDMVFGRVKRRVRWWRDLEFFSIKGFYRIN
jgi:hypothetical protein